MELPELVASTAINLTDGEDEPIHIPGQIQPHGLVLVLQADTLDIVQASEPEE